jgi:aminoglycoside 2''-phosphotransferase
VSGAPDAARALARAGLSARGLRALGSGWDFDAFEDDAGLVWRFARHPGAARGLEREAALLPALAPRLGVRLPVRVWAGEVDGAACAAHRKVPGAARPRPAGAAELEAGSREVARFLSELHGFPPGRAGFLLAEAASAERWRAEQEALLVRASGAIAPRLDAQSWRALARDLESLAAAQFTPVLVHRDLAPEHLLFEGDRLAGVIDFGDAALGDAAIDFAGVLGEWGVSFALAALARYAGPADGGALERARAYARVAPAHAVLSGLEVGDDERVRAGLARLRAPAG